MKTLQKLMITAVVFATAIMFSCSTSPKKGERTEIPEELKPKKEVVNFFATLEEVIDEYANLMERLIEMSEKIDDNENANLADAMSMLGEVATTVIKIAPLIEKLEDLDKKSDKFETELTVEEFGVFIDTYGKIMLRFYEIAKKAEEKGY